MRLHPHQLLTRYIATFEFHRAGLPRAAARLANYVSKAESEILDEPATARALARCLYRGLVCGAVSETELSCNAGLTGSQLVALARLRSDIEGVALGSS